MNDQGSTSNGVTSEQKGEIAASQGILKNAKIGKSSATYKTSTKDEVTKFIKKLNIKTTSKL